MAPAAPVNVVHANDGTLHNFPADAKPEEMQAALDEYEKDAKAGKVLGQSASQFHQNMQVQGLGPKPKTTGSTQNKVVEMARPFTTGPAIEAGAAAAGAVPLPPIGKGLVGLGVGGATYLGLDTLLQRLLDKPPETAKDSLTSSGVNFATTEGLGALLRGAGARIKGMVAERAAPGSISGPIQSLQPTYSQYPDAPGARIAKFLENTFSPASKRAAMENSADLAMKQGTDMAAKEAGVTPGYVSNPNTMANLTQRQAQVAVGPTNPGNLGDGLKQLVETTNSPIPEVDAILKDPRKLQRTLNTGSAPLTNVKNNLKGYKLNQLLQDATTTDPVNPATKSMNAQQLLDNWNDPAWKNSKDLLYNKTTQDNISQFFDGVARTQTGGPGGGLPRVGIIRGSVYLSPALVTGFLHGTGSGAAVAGIELGGAALSKLLTNPEAARLMVAAAKGAPLGVSETFASRIIAGALKGATVNVLDANNKPTPMKLEGGRLVPLAQ